MAPILRERFDAKFLTAIEKYFADFVRTEAIRNMFLARFMETRSSDLEEVRESTLSNAGATYFDAKQLDFPFEFQANAARSEHGSLIFVRANANISLNFKPVSYGGWYRHPPHPVSALRDAATFSGLGVSLPSNR